VTVEKLHEWRGVKPVASPSGVAITTRLRTSPADEVILDALAAHLGKLRRSDLATMCRPQPLTVCLDADARHQARRERLNDRKGRLTAQSSARWANAIIGANNDQYRLARNAQYRHIIGLRAAINIIDKRLAQPTGDTLSAEDPKTRKGRVKGYPTQAERFQKQRRVQHLRAELSWVEADRAANRVRVTDGGKRRAKARHNLPAAELTPSEWLDRWDCARYRIVANGSGDEPFGNLTITVTPGGQVSLRMPKPLEHLANAKHGRYVLSGRAVFSYRGHEWRARITSGQSVSYAITRKAGRAGRYLNASWASESQTPAMRIDAPDANPVASEPVIGVDLNAGHLALRRLDAHGNPVGPPARIDFELSGSSARRDAQVRHAITRLIHYTRRHGIDIIAIEDLDFADACSVGRETMGRGQRGKRFRKTVAGIPTAVFRHRLSAQTSRNRIRLLAVNPAYSSAWGDQHWRTPYENVTRHQAAATVIGRRAQGHKARRRKGVTGLRPEDRDRRATNQAAQYSQPAITDSRHRAGMRGTTSRPPSRTRTRLPGRATVTPAPANNGHQQQ
jgi:hypothetical protein